MCEYERFSVSLALWLFVLGICAPVARAQSPLRAIDYPQGGKIVFGLVDGATTPAAAMSKVLRSVHDACGERPQVGKIFKASGTNSVAIFFMLVNHPHGNVQVAGLLIAAPSGPNKVEAALVSDEAARFGVTVNPMLNRLFSEWPPGGAATTASAPPGASSAAAPAPSVGGEGVIPPMRRVTLADDTASVSLPDGWKLDPKSGGGTIWVTGPQGEQIGLDPTWLGQDPDDPSYRQQVKMHVPPPKQCIVYPHNVDLAKSFPEIFQKLRASNGLGPTTLQIDHAEQVPASQGVRCANFTGHVDPDGKGMRELNWTLCTTAPNSLGMYAIRIYGFTVPNGATDRQRATAAAIVSSFKVNTAALDAQVAAKIAPILDSVRHNWEAQQQELLVRSQRSGPDIRPMGAAAMARIKEAEEPNSEQHAAWWGQDSIPRNGQAFSNYLLDQTVIQDNNMSGNGTIGHPTAWNSTADALVKADPNRYEFVDNPDFWKGVDY